MMQCKDITEDEIIEACNRFHAGLDETPERALAGKYPAKVILAKMEKMAANGKLDYGVSLRTAWARSY